METIIATIKPQYARKIYAGSKKWELRKNAPKCKLPFKVLLCESGSGGEITGEFICDRVFHWVGDMQLRFLQYQEDKLGLTIEEAVDYADGKPLYFWQVTEAKEYTDEKVLTVEDYGLRRVPQSWERLR